MQINRNTWKKTKKKTKSQSTEKHFLLDEDLNVFIPRYNVFIRHHAL